ncbi:hypothetical protein [Evansella clarkii]|uniref:hypothetical protein n=1 Tax=Evansella clarkii TaxID=79879 RepID=UPI001FD4E49C|nr:hypothetical protein [Evansella clarkii]
MMQGICIDKGDTLTLQEGKKYFLFPNGANHFYASRFNSKRSHFGCYRAKHFEVIQEEEEDTPETEVKFEQLALF